MKIFGRFYGTTSPRPVTKQIHTQSNRWGRTPRLDLLFSGKQFQPYIHDTVVSIVYRKKTTRFHIFVKNHQRLRSNKIVKRWNTGVVWRGDIVVMRKGTTYDVVNLRGADASLADFAVKR
ncbi:hypothetical protein BD779DRAFT_1446341 [Infundibulicybe gibba]|nr:hypothetical protein BD779DRAFT_1446341 [Infundibulicybe gibba]